MQMKCVVRALTTCAAVAAIACPAVGQSTAGAIVGLVKDERGRPVANAQVSPQYLGVAVLRALVVRVDTDAEGRFNIDHLDWGPYAVYAGKESDGYPNTMFSLYRHRPAPKVTLSPKHPTGHAIVIIGPRGGVLIGSVRDASTQTLVGSQLILKRPDGSGEIGLSEPSDFRVLIPADTDLSVEIGQQGYKLWTYTPCRALFSG